MPTLTNPSEIAREAFRLLASRRMSPSPENYQALYHEIAGISAAAATPFPERELKALLNALPKEKPAQQRLLKRFEQAFKGKTWEELKRGLGELFAQLGKEQELPWSELFGDFLRQWEGKQAGLTVARKREAMEGLLAGVKRFAFPPGAPGRRPCRTALGSAQPAATADRQRRRTGHRGPLAGGTGRSSATSSPAP
jgi:hypothetical protein